MESIVTWKLPYKDAVLVIESLNERQRSLEEHGKIQAGVDVELRQRCRISRTKAIRLADIIKRMEG